MHSTITKIDAEQADFTDPLRSYRDRFDLPDGVLYLDGNSLGALPKTVRQRVAKTISEEWGEQLIRSWNTADWVHLPQRVGRKIANLIGAGDGSVVTADSTSINLFKVLSAALDLNPGRSKIISERDNFPTDLYIAQGVAKQIGKGHRLVLSDAPSDIPDMLDEDAAVLMLTHVNYRNGYRHDMAALTKMAHDKGILVIWDLCHTAGAMPVDLTGAGADFAIGCGYKYLNGGPGAPAFLYVNPRHMGGFRQPLSGWFGHRAPFDFDPSYAPSSNIEQYLCGTPPVLAMVAMDEAMSLWDDVDMTAVRAKSVTLCDLFIQEVDSFADEFGLKLVTPRDADRRGSQVSYSCDNGYAIMQALIARGVVGDFRAPDIIRFGMTPLYLKFAEVKQAAAILRDILETRAWDAPEFQVRGAVT
ncbi:kynureninase [Phyllobacterium brassicacearum]|uniref:Kynureninase n=1 Tax=Phyllobacterium brassicacearum TaxID=314235 RepID=A0A2P7BCM9_9HYPH|nr:kynureninase [Phyllobacterium brassicacearum]PSH64237.1 kynureninase [Phyllobacterium brassicacearum]TDQ16173.1 kynureninase [Phyllobacterium brassicacearum]